MVVVYDRFCLELRDRGIDGEPKRKNTPIKRRGKLKLSDSILRLLI